MSRIDRGSFSKPRVLSVSEESLAQKCLIDACGVILICAKHFDLQTVSVLPPTHQGCAAWMSFRAGGRRLEEDLP
jgi:hypothetical protein